MNIYLLVKLIHILSATVLFGTGLGTAFFMLQAYRSDDDRAMLQTTRTVVLADAVFTTPAVIVQLATGAWLTSQLGIPFNSWWFAAVIGLFVFVGVCWLPVVRIQIRIRDLVTVGASIADYRRLMRIWTGLGVLAFSSVLVLFYLMVTKVGTSIALFE